jgi:uncharacterized repeat protein (TIGR03803 family)
MKNTLQFPQNFSRSVRMITLALLALGLAVCAQAQTLNYLAAFDGVNGSQPSTVIQATDGNFYAATAGHAAGVEYGNVVKITPAGEISTLYNFCSKAHCSDGAWANTPPILGSDGNLYGVTSGGGSYLGNGGGWGIVYKLTLDGKLATLHTFCTVSPCLDGEAPGGIMQAADGNLYGTTYAAGQFNAGTLFKITPAGVFTVVHAFCSSANCADGQWPEFPPVQGSDGNIYGTTSYGGTADSGVLYDLTPAGRFNVVHTFLCYHTICNRGGDPIGVVQDPEGNLFGVTEFGGIYGDGTLFEITSTHAFINLYSFNSGESDPRAGLIPANDGNFYGTTQSTIFQLTPSGVHTTLYDFTCCTAGEYPLTGLFQATNGNLYGAVEFYNSAWNGAIYSLSTGLRPLVEINPTMGKVGKSVLILGNGLSGSTSVTFNGVQAAFTVESDTYIKATVPKGATTGTVSVITPTGNLNSNPQFVVTK